VTREVEGLPICNAERFSTCKQHAQESQLAFCQAPASQVAKRAASDQIRSDHQIRGQRAPRTWHRLEPDLYAGQRGPVGGKLLPVVGDGDGGTRAALGQAVALRSGLTRCCWGVALGCCWLGCCWVGCMWKQGFAFNPHRPLEFTQHNAADLYKPPQTLTPTPNSKPPTSTHTPNTTPQPHRTAPAPRGRTWPPAGTLPRGGPGGRRR